MQIGCSDGKAYSIDALMALDEAGYTHIVGLQGGYYRFFKVFDNNLRRRRGDGYVEVSGVRSSWGVVEVGGSRGGAGVGPVTPVTTVTPVKA